MNNLCVVSCPISTYSGYGSRSRDFVRSLIEIRPDWDVKILPQRWGNTRQGFLEDSNDTFFTPRLISNLTEKPGCWIQITIPNEFQPIGHFNIGVTAGIETTVCDPSWIQGCNKMNLVLGSSEHTLKVLRESIFEIQDNTTKQIAGRVNLTTPVEVLFEGVDTTLYQIKKEEDLNVNFIDLSSIKENFVFLVVGHWMQGSFGNDRKNIAYTIKSFLETFKNIQNPPALLLKTSQAISSLTDKKQLITKINNIRKSVKGNLPSIYLIHGDLSDSQMNDLYNHPKVKCLVSLTKGEGYGRPLAEFASIGKPVLASNWSGHLDFLKPENTTLINGKLENVDESAIVKNMIIKESQWFKPSDEDVHKSLRSMFKEYNNFTSKAMLQSQHITTHFSYEAMKAKMDALFTQYIPELPKMVNLDLQNIQLPKLKKIQ